MLCKNAARDTYCKRHNLTGKDSRSPSRFITSKEAANEFVTIFKSFLAVYQGYLQKGAKT